MDADDLYTKLFESFDERISAHTADIMVVKILLTILVGDMAKRRGSNEQAKEYIEKVRSTAHSLAQQFDDIDLRSQSGADRSAMFKRNFIGAFEDILGPIQIGEPNK